jgi:hypothetical protein
VRGLRTDESILVNYAGFGLQNTVIDHTLDDLRPSAKHPGSPRRYRRL